MNYNHSKYYCPRNYKCTWYAPHASDCDRMSDRMSASTSGGVPADPDQTVQDECQWVRTIAHARSEKLGIYMSIGQYPKEWGIVLHVFQFLETATIELL